MADLRDMGFDARNVEPEQGRPVFPGGDYPVIVTKSERKRNSKNTGDVLHLTFQFLSGPYQNSTLMGFLNIIHENATTQRIGQGELSSLCRAVDVLSPGDTQELHGIPLVITIIVEEDANKNKSNRITGYKHRNAGRPTQQPAPINQQPPSGPYQPPAQQQQLDPFGNGPTPPPPQNGVYRQPANAASGKTW